MTKAKQDNVEQSKESGTVTTEEGKVVDATTGVASEDNPVAEKVRVLSFDEVEKLVGDLEPGDEGWVPLNTKGEIIGPAQKGMPPRDTVAARVVAPQDTRPHPLTTPSGAHLTHRMNPDPARPEHLNTLQGDESEKAPPAKDKRPIV